MNYQELEKVLQGPLTYTNTSDKKLIEHFQEKFKMVPYNNDFLFIFHHEREFENKNHIISLHQRNSGRVPMHIFHYIVITYVYSGTMIITVENDTVTLNAGDVNIFE